MPEAFHFIRPAWLLGIPVAVLITAAVWQLRDARLAWRGIIAPPLLDALLVRSERRRRLIPVHLIAAAALVAPLALAGPTWQREPSPFAEETAALVVVIEVTDSMLTEDIAPSRLARAGQKVADLLERRPDTHTALIAYSGTAHVAMPLTRDTSIIAGFAAALRPEVMPEAGDAAADALGLATEQLERAGRSGSILLISDGASDADAGRVDGDVPVHVLAMSAAAAPPSLERIARATGGSVVVVTPDARDVERLATRAERDIGRVASAEDAGQWRDSGYWLLPLLVVITLAWSRRGWAIGFDGLAGAGGAP